MGYSVHSRHMKIQNLLMAVTLIFFAVEDLRLGRHANAAVSGCFAFMMALVTVSCWRNQ
jgi:hypothetical protein